MTALRIKYLLARLAREQLTGITSTVMYHGVVGDYIPQLTIRADAQSPENDHRIVNSSVEFRIGTTPWRILTDEEIRSHFRLHTEIAAWLERECKNSWVWS